jgi:predicted transcriptional regulator
MAKVTLGISSREAINRRALAAFESGQVQEAFIGFASAELLWKTLTLKRWQILQAMTGAGELSIREVARRVGRDVKAVHGDMAALMACGIVEKTERGKVVFPYDAVHVDFLLLAA